MPSQQLQEQLQVDWTQELALLVVQSRAACQLNLPFNAGIRGRVVTPGISFQIDGNLWLRSHKDQEVFLAYLHERAKRYSWYNGLLQSIKKAVEEAQQASILAGNSGISQSILAEKLRASLLPPSANAGQRSTGLPTSHSSPASISSQGQAVNARQRDPPFQQAGQQIHQPRVDHHGGPTMQSQHQSDHQARGQQIQGSTLPSIQSLGFPPGQVQTQSSVRGPTLPPMQAPQSHPSVPLVAAREYPQGSDAPAGRLGFPLDTLAMAQAHAATTGATGSRSQMIDSQPICENCGKDVKFCSCISGDEDEFLIDRARQMEVQIQNMNEKHEQIRAKFGSLTVREVDEKRRLEEDNKRTLQHAERVKEARRNRKARIAQDTAAADSEKRGKLNSQQHQRSTAAMKERDSSLSPRASPTFVSKRAVSEAGGSGMAPDNGKVRAKPHSLSQETPMVLEEELSDRHDDTQSPNPASVRGSASQGQSVLAGHRRVTDPSPRMVDGAYDLLRLHRPSHLKSTKETNEAGVDQRSASPRKAEGGKDWHEAYRERRSRSDQEH